MKNNTQSDSLFSRLINNNKKRAGLFKDADDSLKKDLLIENNLNDAGVFMDVTGEEIDYFLDGNQDLK